MASYWCAKCEVPAEVTAEGLCPTCGSALVDMGRAGMSAEEWLRGGVTFLTVCGVWFSYSGIPADLPDAFGDLFVLPVAVGAALYIIHAARQSRRP